MSFVSDLRAVAQGRDFRRLFATRLVSQLSDGTFQVALASLFFFSPERQTSAPSVAAAFAVLLLPYSLVGPFAGVLLDRWRRRQLLVRANLLRAAMVLGVASMVVQGLDGLPLYGLVLACLSVNRFFLAGLSAALPHVVDRDELVMANSVATTCGAIAALLGGTFGLLGRLVLGEGAATDATLVALAAGGYLLSATLAARMHPDLLGPDDDPRRPAAREAVRHVASGLADGVRHVSERRPAALALAAIAGHRLAYGVSTIVTILLCRSYFSDPADINAGLALLGLVVGVSGLGFVLAALVTPVATDRMRPSTWIVVCFTAAGVVESIFVGWLTVPLLLGGAFVLGVTAQGSKICVDTIVQRSVEDAYRGRVFSLYDVLFNMSFLLAAALAALVVPPDGHSPAVYAALAAIYLATAFLYSRATRGVAAHLAEQSATGRAEPTSAPSVAAPTPDTPSPASPPAAPTADTAR